ncbi:MAG: DNRLRE domain-containing protein [Vicinamibacterales bacterium]
MLPAQRWIPPSLLVCAFVASAMLHEGGIGDGHLLAASTRIKDITFEGTGLTDSTTGVDLVRGGVLLDTLTALKGAASATVDDESTAYLEENIIPAPELYVSFYLRLNGILSGTPRIVLISNAGTTMGSLMLTNQGRLRLRGSSTIGVESAPLIPGRLYRVGVHQKKGTGANAILEAFLASDDTPFGAPFAATTLGTWTTAATRLRIGNTSTGGVNVTVDDIRLDTMEMPAPSPAAEVGTSAALIADAQVKDSSPNTNYGELPTLRSRLGDPTYRSYLKFDVTGTGGVAVAAATLRLYATADAPGIQVYASDDTGWMETGITWNTAGAVNAALLGSSDPVVHDTWINIPLDPSVFDADTLYTLVLVGTTSTSAYFSSREGGHPPLLILTGSAERPVVDQYQLVGSEQNQAVCCATSDPLLQRGQVFTVGKQGLLAGVELSLYAEGVPGSLEISVLSMSGHTDPRTAPVLGTVLLPVGSQGAAPINLALTSMNATYIDLSSLGIQVQVADVLAIRLQVNAELPSLWAVRTSIFTDHYAGGFYYAAGSSFFEPAIGDAAFKTFVIPGP